MQKNRLIVLFLLPLFLAGCALSPSVQEQDKSTLVVGEVYTLSSGETLHGNMAVVGSSITIEEGAVVDGEISFIGSTANIAGEVTGNIYAFGGSTTLASSAIIDGDVNQLFHELNMDPGASVSGEINTYSSPLAFKPAWTGISAFFPYISNPERVLTSRLIFTAIFCLLACLIVYLLPKPAQNLIRTIQNQPGVCWGVGFLFLLIFPLFLLILTITICLSPIALVLLVVFLLAFLFGWIAQAAILGEKINKWLYLKMPPVLQTLVGALILAIVISFLSLIPCIGIVASMIIGCYGLGGVVISRFGKIEDNGTKRKKQSPIEPSKPPEPPQPPQPPEESK